MADRQEQHLLDGPNEDYNGSDAAMQHRHLKPAQACDVCGLVCNGQPAQPRPFRSPEMSSDQRPGWGVWPISAIQPLEAAPSLSPVSRNRISVFLFLPLGNSCFLLLSTAARNPAKTISRGPSWTFMDLNGRALVAKLPGAPLAAGMLLSAVAVTGTSLPFPGACNNARLFSCSNKRTRP